MRPWRVSHKSRNESWHSVADSASKGNERRQKIAVCICQTGQEGTFKGQKARKSEASNIPVD